MGRVFKEPALTVWDRAWFHAFCAQSGLPWLRLPSAINTSGRVKCCEGVVRGQIHESGGVYCWDIYLYDSNKPSKSGSAAKIEPAARDLLTMMTWYRLGEGIKQILPPELYKCDGPTLRAKMGINR